MKHNLHVQARIIDCDYHGDIKILLVNESDTEFHVATGMRIAQLIILHTPTIKIEETQQPTKTKRDTKDFGSTGTHKITSRHTPVEHDQLSPHAAAAALVDNDITDDNILPYNVICSDDPFTDFETITIPVRGQHTTQGLILKECPYFENRIVINSVQPSTSPRNIKKRIRRIKHCHLLQINDTPIQSVQQANNMLSKITKNVKKFSIRVSEDQRNYIHPDKGLPMLYFDQLSTISKHLHNIKFNNNNNSTTSNIKLNNSPKEQQQYITKIINAMKTYGNIKAAKAILPKNKCSSNKLTRRKLKNLPTWTEWQQSEYKQLDQYYDQHMFGEPCRLPAGANVLDLLWTYLVKTDGTKKARCVCNGQPKFKGTVIFGYTFAKMLDHVGSRIF